MWDIAGRRPMATFTKLADRLLNPVLGQDPRGLRPQAVDGSSDADVPARRCEPMSCTVVPSWPRTVDAIAEWQLPNGMIPWFPGGHADPWNHVEAAMALALGGRRDDGRARPTTGWCGCSGPTARGTSTTWPTPSSRTSSTPTSCAYVATGVWHHWLLFGDAGFVETMWPVVERAIDFVLDLQTPAWRDHLGPPRRRHAVVVRAAHRLVEHLPHRCAARSPSPSSSATSGPTGSCPRGRLANVDRPSRPDAFAPKHRWAMDWYYPVLAGVRRRRARAALDWPTAPTRSSSTAWACAASATDRGSPWPRRASACSPT